MTNINSMQLEKLQQLDMLLAELDNPDSKLSQLLDASKVYNRLSGASPAVYPAIENLFIDDNMTQRELLMTLTTLLTSIQTFLNLNGFTAINVYDVQTQLSNFQCEVSDALAKYY